MREIVHIQVGQCGNQIGAKVRNGKLFLNFKRSLVKQDGEKLFQNLANAENNNIT